MYKELPVTLLFADDVLDLLNRSLDEHNEEFRRYCENNGVAYSPITVNALVSAIVSLRLQDAERDRIRRMQEQPV